MNTNTHAIDPIHQLGTNLTRPGRLAFAFGLSLAALLLLTSPGSAASFFFTTGDPDGKIATLSRPPGAGKIQTETADDFTLTNCVVINQATITGLIPSAAPLTSIQNVEVEIYRLFPGQPGDTDPTNTIVPNPIVPTRTGSPADFEIDDATRDGLAGSLSFSPTLLSSSFTAANSVANNINRLTNQFTGGEGGVVGEEVRITISFDPPIALPPGHYFFRPEVQLSSGDFLWLSAPKPIPAPADLQSWIRSDLTPDLGGIFPNWLRIGTDITHQGPFNAAFSLSGETDADCDEVGDSLDLCPNTPSGTIVNADGCSIEQLAPCAGPAPGVSWKNHGEYVGAVAQAAESFLEAGLISADQKDAIVVQAAQSACGVKSRITAARILPDLE